MKFMLMLCGDEAAGAQADEMAGCAEWQEKMSARGVLLDAVGLHPPASAGTVRVRAGEVLLTDGPFAETKEQIGGITLIECADQEEAQRIAATHPWAELGTIEVRPIYG